MLGYREGLIIRYTMLNGSALLALIALFVTSNSNYLVYAGFMTIYLIVKRPTMRGAVSDLQLNEQEIATLQNPDSIIC